MNAERMKNSTNKNVDMDKLALDIIKGNYQVISTEKSCSLECAGFFEANIVLPDGITLTVTKEGWGF